MRPLIVFCVLSLLPGLAWSGTFSTQETVELVILCMEDIGGQSEENLYTCSCRHDFITEHMGYDAYERASIFERYRNMPADKGQLFRDAKDAEGLRQQLKEVSQQAAVQCPVVKQIVAPPPPAS